jgi:GNAT superfamily N-acetyltransferase
MNTIAREQLSSMSFNPPLSNSCKVLTAGPADVDRAFCDLSRDMDPNFVHVFLDKLQRYAAKSDRALFLAEYQDRIIAFATIIDKAPAPDGSDESTVRLFGSHACGTGLMVLPEFRRQGVAAILVNHWEKWATRNKRQGIWVISRQMADWYQRHFAYSIHGVTIRHGVKKTILLKTFGHSNTMKR